MVAGRDEVETEEETDVVQARHRAGERRTGQVPLKAQGRVGRIARLPVEGELEELGPAARLLAGSGRGPAGHLSLFSDLRAEDWQLTRKPLLCGGFIYALFEVVQKAMRKQRWKNSAKCAGSVLAEDW